VELGLELVPDRVHVEVGLVEPRMDPELLDCASFGAFVSEELEDHVLEVGG